MDENIDQELVDYFESQVELCGDRLSTSSMLFEDLRIRADRGELNTRTSVIALSNAFVTLEGRIASLEIATRESD